MNWYYVEKGQQLGPLSEEALEELRRTGRIKDESLVWSEGMTEWQTLRDVRPVGGPSTPPSLAAVAKCAECQQSFSLTDLVTIGRYQVCAGCKPTLLQRLREGAKPVGGVWRHGGQVVVSRDAFLPDRCVKCNAPAGGYRLRRKLYWHPPVVYVLLISPLIYILVATLVNKRGIVDIGLCQRHRKQRWWAIGLGWLVGALGIVCLFGAGSTPGGDYLLPFGFVLLLCGLVGGIAFSRGVSAGRIDAEVIRLNGTSAAFRDELDEWR